MPFAANIVEVSDETPERILGEDGGRAYRNFLSWTVGDGFALAILEITEPRRRNELAVWTANQVPETRVVELDRASGKPLRPLLEAACAPPKPAILVFMRLEEAGDRLALFARLNVQRDELVRDFAVPWVIMIHPAASLEMRMHAPDMVHFAGLWLREEAATMTVKPLTADLHTQDAAPSSPLLTQSRDPNLLAQAENALTLSRLDEAADLLAQADLRDPDGRMTDGTRLYLRGGLAWRRGLPDEALALLEAAAEVFEQAGNARSQAITMGKMADILVARGQLDEALRIRRDVEIPVYESIGDARSRAIAMGKVADVLLAWGQLDEALRILREDVEPVFERIGDMRHQALAMGKIADVLTTRGLFEEALRIRRSEELPVYRNIGDMSACAITMSKIADILQARGELDEALRIRREETLPVFEQLGDIRSRAMTMGKVADILQLRGQLDEALRVRREEELPVYERLGEVREWAVAKGKVADILELRGQLDEALRIRHDEELPVYERVGDVRAQLVTRTKLAVGLAKRGNANDSSKVVQHLASALTTARRLRLPEVQQIKTIVRALGKDPDSPPFGPA